MEKSTQAFPFGLRLALLLSGLEGLVLAITSMGAPKLVADLSGLPGQDLPVYQQAGAAALGYALQSLLSFRAKNWEQIRIPVFVGFIVVLFTALGAFYYVVLLGVAKPYLIFILAFSIYLTAAFAYYLWSYSKQTGGLNL
ncbi:MAG: hypothetical protein HY070_05095 [Chloroflexi bacterium]|nr:hypothetical protein [Chloroflexota bacterium]MBI3742381.1 hypothetical protein [Chloroflexota bacterium]